jgi:TRAP-type mannitol/chloroaromatic compound transport system permease small subunit
MRLLEADLKGSLGRDGKFAAELNPQQERAPSAPPSEERNRWIIRFIVLAVVLMLFAFAGIALLLRLLKAKKGTASADSKNVISPSRKT